MARIAVCWVLEQYLQLTVRWSNAIIISRSLSNVITWIIHFTYLYSSPAFSCITVGLDGNPDQSKTAQGSDCCSLAAYSLRERCDTALVSECPLVSCIRSP